MNLIDATYFKYDPIKVKGIEGSNGFSAELSNERNVELDRAIEIHEQEYLIKLLGQDLYTEYAADKENVKWDTLKSKLVNGTLFRSPIANYVYYMFMKQRKYATGDIGVYIPKAENMTVVDPSYMLKQAWNDGVDQNIIVCEWIYSQWREQGWTAELTDFNWVSLLTRQPLFG